jgi:AraC-like DNA-binding protein
LLGDDIRISYREGVISEEHIFENHCHARYEMIAVIEGEICLVIENRKYELTAGRIAIIPPLKYHSVFTIGNTVYKRMTALFDGSFIPNEITGELLRRISAHPVAANGELDGLLCSMKDIFGADECEKFFPLARALILHALYIHAFGEILPSNEISNPTVMRVTEYIDLHIGEKILLDDIAAELFLSKSTLCHIFSDEMKISPKQYILQKKLSFAAMLIESGVSASEASVRIGYDNYANFYKMYVKHFGISPKSGKGR